jgi:hypothetical protein
MSRASCMLSKTTFLCFENEQMLNLILIILFFLIQFILKKDLVHYKCTNYIKRIKKITFVEEVLYHQIG